MAKPGSAARVHRWMQCEGARAAWWMQGFSPRKLAKIHLFALFPHGNGLDHRGAAGCVGAVAEPRAWLSSRAKQ